MKRFLPLLVLLCLIGLAYLGEYSQAFSVETFTQHQKEIREFVDNNALTAPLTFIGLFMVTTLLCLPVGLLMMLLGGFLFPQPWSTLYVLIGATAGSTLLFLATRSAFEGLKWNGFKKNAASLLLFFRFIPLFPVWVLNTVPATLKVPLRTFLWTSVIGMTPGALALTQAGKNFQALLANPQNLHFGSLLSVEFKIALVILGFLALAPLAFTFYYFGGAESPNSAK